MSEVNLETIETTHDTTNMPTKAVPRSSTKRESPLRRLIAKAFKPTVRQAAVVVFDQGFCSIANFLTGVLVARACSKAEYGLYVLGFTLLMTSMGIQTSLSGTPFTVFSPRLRDKERQFYLGSTLVQHLAVSAFAALGFLAAAVVVSSTGRTDGFANVLLALAVASVFVLLRDFMRYVLLAQLRVWASLLMGLAANFATVGMLLLAYRGGWLTAPVAYLILGGCSGLPVFFVLLRERKQITFATKKLREHLKENWRFGKWLVGQVITLFLSVHIYPWALMFFRDNSAAGVYGACVGLAAILNPFFMGLNRFLCPRAAHAACKGASRVHREVYLCMAATAGPLIVFLICAFLFGEWGITLIYGSKFTGIGFIFAVYSLSAIIAAEGVIISAGTNAMRRPDISLKAQFVGFISTITFGFFLVYKLGPLGAAIGVCISRVLAVGYQFAKFQVLERMGLEDFVKA